jgi:hypothetical protein
MGDIERWWLAADPRGRGLAAYHAEAVARNQAARGNGGVIEVVPAEQLRGAVQALEQIRDLLGELREERLTVAQVAAAWRIASDAADHLEGR